MLIFLILFIMGNNFSEFVGQYEISKTLRFELKPIGEDTEKLLKENQVFEVDRIRKQKYIDIKPYFNKLHLEFIEFSLNDIFLDFSGYYEKLIALKKEKKKDISNYSGEKDSEKRKDKDKILKKINDELKKQEEILREQIVEQFNKKSFDFVKNYDISFKKLDDNKKEDKKNKKHYEFLFEKGIFKLLKEKYSEEKETIKYYIDKNGEKKEYSIFDDWDDWMGYLSKFFETRRNLYKSDGTSTAVATRIIDDNLKRFCENLEIFNKVKQKVDFSELEQDFDLILEEFFSINFYNKCILQKDIDKYNEVIGGTKDKKKDGLNKYINEYRQRNPGEKLAFFKKLDKQILSEKEKFIEQIDNEIEFKKTLEEFLKNSKRKVSILEKIFGKIDNFNDEDYKKIYFSKIAFNTISHKFTDKIKLFEKNLFEEMKKDDISGIKYDKKQDKYSFPDFIPLYYIKKALEKYSENELFFKSRYYKQDENLEKNDGILEQNNNNLWEKFCKILKFEFDNILEKKVLDLNGEQKIIGYNLVKNNLENILTKEDFILDEKSRGIIKDFADYTLALYQMGKYFAIEKKGNWLNHIEISDEFYSEENENGYFKFYEDSYEQIILPYNLMRNYISKKPWEEKGKWKLNFDNSSFLKGWDKNKEISYSGVILRKEEKYFLCKINNNSVFSDNKKQEFLEGIGEGKYEKMIYKFLKDVSLSIPKNTTQLKAVIKHFQNSDEDYFLTKSSSLGDFKKPLKITKRIFELNNRIYLKENLEISVLRGTIKKDDEKKYIKIFQKEFISLGGDKKLYRQALDDWMNFSREFVKVYPSCDFFDYSKLKNNQDYNSLDEFYKDLDSFSYNIDFQEISEKYIKEKLKNKEIYLFEIHNKDWNLKDGEKKTGIKNLHTIYFENLFSDKNKENNFILKLNGEAEVFFRPKTEEKKLGKRLDNSGKEVIKHKRYSKEKILFHFPITLNRGIGTITENIFNQKINEFLANNPEINILGIDRGEKHLAYYSVINQKEEILESGSLNFIEQIDKNGEKIKFNKKKIEEIRNDEGKIIDYKLVETGEKIEYIDYKTLLDFKEKKRKIERQSWKEVEQIKDLKKGYISAVVNKITNLIIEYNAIVIFEDLNMRFKQIRGGIEKSVYQQLEKALIDKLNFLVKKGEIDSKKAGNLLKAYQLTAPISSFKDMGKQTGIIFYTQASYTSKIDPLTGWRPNLYLKKQKAEINKQNILKFSEITFNKDKNRFDISYDLKNFLGKDSKFPKKTSWTLSTCVERWKWDRNMNNNKGGYKYFDNLTKEFEKLFENYNINIDGNIKEQIQNLEEKGNEKFFSNFIDLFNLLCQIRNTNEKENGDNNDIILSPVEPFFDSRRTEKFGKNLPKNGDDNGAFNIARKGLVILEKINSWKENNEKLKKEGKKGIFNPDLFISNKDWDEFCTK